MSKKYTIETRQEILTRIESGKRVSSIYEDTGVPRSTIYDRIKTDAEETKEKEFKPFDYKTLQRRNERLKTIIEVLKSVNCPFAMCAYLKLLNVTQSFSKSHNPYDNRLWSPSFLR